MVETVAPEQRQALADALGEVTKAIGAYQTDWTDLLNDLATFLKQIDEERKQAGEQLKQSVLLVQEGGARARGGCAAGKNTVAFRGVCYADVLSSSSTRALQ